MVEAKQVQTGQLTTVTPGQITTAPGVLPAQIDIGTLITSLMPLLMLMMVMLMIMPMFKGISEAFKAS